MSKMTSAQGLHRVLSAARVRLSAARPPMVKAVPIALSASAAPKLATQPEGSIRFPVHLDATIARWRLHIRNHNDRFGLPFGAGAWLRGVWVGRHAGDGAFAEEPTRVVEAFGLPVNNRPVTTPWVAAPALGGGAEALLSLGWHAATGENAANPAGCYRSRDPQLAGQASGDGFRAAAYAPFSWWLEVETPVATPVLAMWGDSITVGTGNGCILHDSPLAQHCRRVGALPVHHAFPGTGMSQWKRRGSAQWTRWEHLARPDAVVHFMGQNDLNSAGSLSGMQRRFANTIEVLHEHVSPDVYVGTLTPHARKSVHTNDVRRAYNDWLRTLPSGSLGLMDFCAAVQNDANDALQPRFDSGDTLHLSTTGSTALADVLTAHGGLIARGRAR